MDLGSIFVILALFVLVGLIISKPLFENKAAQNISLEDQEEHELSALLAQRDQVLDNLNELDLDFAVGKIPETDYPVQRHLLLERGAHILQELDKHLLASDISGEAAEISFDERLELAIAARREDMHSDEGDSIAKPPPDVITPLSNPDDDLEVLIANRKRKRNDRSAGFCPKCGGPIQKSDHFCPKCGTTLT